MKLDFERADASGAWYRLNGLLTYVSWEWVRKESRNPDERVARVAKLALQERKQAN